MNCDYDIIDRNYCYPISFRHNTAMTKHKNIPDGYLDRNDAAQILGLSATMFDRIASTEFANSRIKIGKGLAFYYSKAELETYRDFRERRKQAGNEELTWKYLVAQNEELTALNADLALSVRILLWVLRPMFPAGKETDFSAAHTELKMPDKYQQAKQVLSGFGLDIEDLRKRMAHGQVGKVNEPSPVALNNNPKYNPPPPLSNHRLDF